MQNERPARIPAHATPVFEGQIFTVWQWEQTLFDGSTTTFEAIERVDAALAVGVLPEKRILMVRDEQPHRGPLIASPGGRLEKGEDPKAAVVREFLEETGYKPGSVTPWFARQSEGKVLYGAHFFIAKDLQLVGKPTLDPGEKIELLEFSFDEFLQLAWNPKLREQELRITLLEALADPQKKQALHDLLFS